MLCPVCKTPQIIVEFKNIELDLCVERCGIWFDEDELRQLFDVVGAPQMLRDLDLRLEELPRGFFRRWGARVPTRRCPRCSRKMKHVRDPASDKGVILDRCPADHGTWFDHGELEQIMLSHLGERDKSLLQVREFLGSFSSTGPVVEPVDEESEAHA